MSEDKLTEEEINEVLKSLKIRRPKIRKKGAKANPNWGAHQATKRARYITNRILHNSRKGIANG